MTRSDWWMFVSFYQNVIALPLGFVLFILLVRARSLRARAKLAASILVVFLPHIQVYAGNLYFDYLCRTQAGEFVYRTVDDVEGILQMRPRDGSKDYFDRMARGDIPEDPWGHTNAEAQRPWMLFHDYRYFEKLATEPLRPMHTARENWHPSLFVDPPPYAKYARYFGYDGRDQKTLKREFDTKHRSKYGYTWREAGGPVARVLNVFPGEVTVVEVRSGQVLAQMRGVYRVRPTRICGVVKDEQFVVTFLKKVLIPAPVQSEAPADNEVSR